MPHLHIDIETYSDIDISSAGAYRYTQSIFFEILMVAWSVDDGPIHIISPYDGDDIHFWCKTVLLDPQYILCAHNAVFERLCFAAIGYTTAIDRWECSVVKAAYSGLPLSLGMVSQALELGELGKLDSGKALIRYFCMPCKPTKANGKRDRNYPEHAPEKWEEFKKYCINDVEAEREVLRLLAHILIPPDEVAMYRLDQKINDRGVLIDLEFAAIAKQFDERNRADYKQELKELTGLENPNSLTQLKGWIFDQSGIEVKSLAKDKLKDLIDGMPAIVSEALRIRKKLSKTSTKKYAAMFNCVGRDARARGLFQFYGASRTGRWAGRLIQLQNLPRNKINDLEQMREAVLSGDYGLIKLLFDDVSDILSQLIRTTFKAPKGYVYAVADFSAIEARVVAWLAGEQWRIDVFNSHGKIYEASAAMMFNVPLESIGKGSDLRSKGKVAELALGYQGGVNALKTMGGESMGLDEPQMKSIVKLWRAANQNIQAFWYDVERCAMKAVRYRKKVKGDCPYLTFDCDGDILTIKLPSGRSLIYRNPCFKPSRFNPEKMSLHYDGMNQVTRKWGPIVTYGGKLTENIVQAVARDLLVDSMLRLDKAGFDIVMHVHDESIAEVLESDSEKELKRMCDIMGAPIDWAPGLPLDADGYITPFYKKD